MTRIRKITVVALFAACAASAALFVIPNPFLPTVPFTLQVFVVLLAGIVLEPSLAVGSMVTYLAVGALGVPVYAGATGGLAHLFGPTGGFLLSYPLAAAVTSFATGARPNIERAFLAAMGGLAVIYVLGFFGLHVFAGLPLDFKTALPLATFVPWDIAKAALAAIVGSRLKRQFR